jgi:DNA mismatch repair protein MutL
MGLAEAYSARADAPEARAEDIARPLGAARAQLHGCYIVSQTSDGVVLVDMHAAHERLVYEKLKAQRAEHGVPAQALLIPEIVELGDGAEQVLAVAEDLSALGLVVEPFGPGAVAVRETPAILGAVNADKLMRDILDELDDQGDSTVLGGKIDAVLSRMACHGSIRSGREMRPDEMNALLREMEATPLSGQCNHGRPTYVTLGLGDIEKLFGRA